MSYYHTNVVVLNSRTWFQNYIQQTLNLVLWREIAVQYVAKTFSYICILWYAIDVVFRYAEIALLTDDKCDDFYPFDLDYAQPRMFDPFNLNGEKDYTSCTDFDPDSCYYNELRFFYSYE